METLKSTGTDDMLKHDIEKWVNRYNEPNTNNLTTAILAAVIYVANQLLVQKAVLLLWACHVFLESYNGHHTYTGSIKSVKLILEFDEGHNLVRPQFLTFSFSMLTLSLEPTWRGV